MFPKGVAVVGFPFVMVSSTTGDATAGLTVTCRILKDGGAQATSTNSAADEGNGQYSIDFTSTEFNATMIGLMFTATGAVPVGFAIKTVVTDLDIAVSELAAVPAANAGLGAKINWLFALARNKLTQTSTTTTLRNDADSASIATSTDSEDGTTFTRGEWT